MYVKVNHPEKQCAWCEELFKPRTSHQHFCGKSCYRKFGKKYGGHSRGNKETLAVKFRLRATKKKRPYRSFVKDQCERCGFIPVHICQLDVDHVDGDHKNNAPENLQTLCANCHRLKTFEGRDWEPR